MVFDAGQDSACCRALGLYSQGLALAIAYSFQDNSDIFCIAAMVPDQGVSGVFF
jgi:hypothetical protein